MNSFWSILVTVISGVLVYILCEFFAEFFLRPIQKYKELKGEVVRCLIFYANLYSNTVRTEVSEDEKKEYADASLTMRKLASGIAAYAELRPWLAFRLVPSKKDLNQAAHELIGLSNSCPPQSDTFMQQNCVTKKKICRLLKTTEMD